MATHLFRCGVGASLSCVGERGRDPKPGQVKSLQLLMVIILICGLWPQRADALEPDQIALIVNTNVPASRQLAELYATARAIPPGRIIGVSLPAPEPGNPLEGMPFTEYEPRVAQPVRDFLRKNDLDRKVICLVTFWGMPLRIDRRVNTPRENEEAGQIERDLTQLRSNLEAEVSKSEQIAHDMNPSFKPAVNGNDLQQLVQRLDSAINVSLAGLLSMPDTPARKQSFGDLVGVIERLTGGNATVERLATPTFAPLMSRPITSAQLAATHDKEADLKKIFGALNPDNLGDREKMRHLAQTELGLLGLAQVLASQQATTEVRETESSLDNELALIWWGRYGKYRWQISPLYWRAAAMKAPQPTIMVMRLDAPSEQIVRDMIATSVEVEKNGLQGQIALDARGKAPPDPYGVYDQTIRNLAHLVQTRTKLQVTLDDKEALFSPGSVKNVALYCGWYSLRNYVPGCQFNRGAVGFHIASSELVSLRTPRERGWVHGLLEDGVVGSLGPVAEPYLHSFPPADEFFPLLLTGKLTLAEVYWRSNPLVSWMQSFIGDPLYTPYKVHPALAVTDLPEPLRAALKPIPSPNFAPATQPG